MSSDMRINTVAADGTPPKKPVSRAVPKPAQDAFVAAMARYRKTQPQPHAQQGQKTNVAPKADKSSTARQSGNANGKQTGFTTRTRVNDGLQADKRPSRTPNAKDDGLEDAAVTEGIGWRGGDGVFVARAGINDELEEEMAALTGVGSGAPSDQADLGEYADLSLLAEEDDRNWAFSDAGQGLFASGSDDAMWATDASADLSNLAASLAPLAGDDGIFEVFLPNGGKLGVVVNTQPNMVRIHLSPDSDALAVRLRRRRMELQGQLGRHTEKDVEITVL